MICFEDVLLLTPPPPLLPPSDLRLPWILGQGLEEEVGVGKKKSFEALKLPVQAEQPEDSC